MSQDERDFLDKLRSTSVRAAADMMESLQRLRSFQDEILDEANIPRRSYADSFYQLAKLELEHAEKVMRLGSMQAEMLFDHVRQLARGARGDKAPVQVVELTATEGHVYRGSFEVKNPFDKPADVRFVVSKLRDSANYESKVHCTATARPTQIASGGTGTIELEIDDPGTLLFGEIDVFLSADVEKKVHRKLKVRPHG